MLSSWQQLDAVARRPAMPPALHSRSPRAPKVELLKAVEQRVVLPCQHSAHSVRVLRLLPLPPCLLPPLLPRQLLLLLPLLLLLLPRRRRRSIGEE